MKLKNKKTGEIIDDGYVRETHDFQLDGQKHVLAVFKGNGHRPPERVSGAYTSLAELNEEWEDYEEPKDHIAISWTGDWEYYSEKTPQELVTMAKEIGNWFETIEEAELAVRKLKAWKRLKDRGVTFEIKCINHKKVIEPMAEEETTTFSDAARAAEDLEIIFGGEE